MTTRKTYLVCYDISQPKNLRRVYKAVLAYRIGGQKSLSECWMTKAEIDGLIAEITSIYDPATDRLHVFELDPRQKPMLFGLAESASRNPFIVV